MRHFLTKMESLLVMQSRRSHAFYAYFDAVKSKYYFHDPINNKRLWYVPAGSLVLDPNTNKPFDRLELAVEPTAAAEAKKESHISPLLPPESHTLRCRTNSLCMMDGMLQSPDQSRKSLRRGRKSTLFMSLRPGDSPQAQMSADSLPFYLPPVIKEDQHSTDLSKFTTSSFNTRTRGMFLMKKEIPPDELFLYSTDPSVLPLLKTTPQSQQKAVVACFTFILDYVSGSNDARASKLVANLFSSPQIIDEVFVLLLKQTRNNPSLEGCLKVWELLLVVCTFFPTSKPISIVVRNILADASLGSNPKIASIAKIAYLRFLARCDSGETLPKQKDEWVDQLPNPPNDHHFVFGAPLLELIFQQRRQSPQCTIPLFMHNFVKAIIAHGAKETEGMFRLPGNKLQIEAMMEAIHAGEDVFKNGELTNLGSLFKRWLADLPEPIVPMSMYSDLCAALEKQDPMPFIERLPRANHDTLAYLVGFLQEFVTASSVTKMTIIPVSMIFGANVVRIVSLDQNEMKKCTDNGRILMEYLIKNWDVSFIYPLPEEFCNT